VIGHSPQVVAAHSPQVVVVPQKVEVVVVVVVGPHTLLVLHSQAPLEEHSSLEGMAQSQLQTDHEKKVLLRLEDILGYHQGVLLEGIQGVQRLGEGSLLQGGDTLQLGPPTQVEGHLGGHLRLQGIPGGHLDSD